MTKSITKSDLETIKLGLDHYFEKVQRKNIENIDRCHELRSLDSLKKSIDNYRKAEDTRQAMMNALQIVSDAMSDKNDGAEIDTDWAISEALANVIINY